MRTYAKAAVSAIAIVLAGCAGGSPPVASGAVASAYTASLVPPAGSARVYVLPTRSKGLFSDMEGRAELFIFPEDSERGAELGFTNRSSCIAFDIAPGDYDLVAHGDDAFSKFTKLFNFEPGKTYFLRPTFFRSAKDVTTSADTGMGFDVVDPAAAEAEVRQLAVVQVSRKGEEFLKHTYAAAAPAAPAVQPAAAPAVPAYAPPPPPPPAQVDAGLEDKLKTLRRLQREGLITQPEYDAKRKALLDAY